MFIHIGRLEVVAGTHCVNQDHPSLDLLLCLGHLLMQLLLSFLCLLPTPPCLLCHPDTKFPPPQDQRPR